MGAQEPDNHHKLIVQGASPKGSLLRPSAMAFTLAGIIGHCLLGVATASQFCPYALNTGSVGSCMIGSCSASRGPTHCTFGGCYCNEGYCRYPASTVHVQSRYCVSRIPDKTCHLTRFCWSGGLSESFCESGLCMCKFGYKAEKNEKGEYECAAATSELAAAIALNATAEEIQTLLEYKNHSEGMASQNVLIATAWCGCSVFALALGMVALMKPRRGGVADQDYTSLLG